MYSLLRVASTDVWGSWVIVGVLTVPSIGMVSGFGGGQFWGVVDTRPSRAANTLSAEVATLTLEEDGRKSYRETQTCRFLRRLQYLLLVSWSY